MGHRKQVLHLTKVVVAMFLAIHSQIVAPIGATDTVECTSLVDIDGLSGHIIGNLLVLAYHVIHPVKVGLFRGLHLRIWTIQSEMHSL